MKLQLTTTLCTLMLLLAFQAALHFTRAAPMAESHHTKALPGDVTLQSLHGVADTVATETSTVAYNTYVFMRQFFDKDPPHQTPCFNTERNTSADYLSKLKEDYRIAAGYSGYYQAVVTFYSHSLQQKPDSPFNHYFYTLKTRTAEIQQSIANMVHQVDSNAELTTPTPPTSPSLSKKDDAVVDCTDVCLKHLARVTRNLLTFISDYVQPDLAGIVQERGSGKK